MQAIKDRFCPNPQKKLEKALADNKFSLAQKQNIYNDAKTNQKKTEASELIKAGLSYTNVLIVLASSDHVEVTSKIQSLRKAGHSAASIDRLFTVYYTT